MVQERERKKKRVINDNTISNLCQGLNETDFM